MFTKENETDCKINFLNLTLIREGNTVITRWFKKSFASGRLLNYMSSHKRTTILGTAIHFIKTVLILSDGRFYNENRGLVVETLRENNFPETLIMKLIQEYYTYMRPIYKGEEETFYFYENFELKYENRLLEAMHKKGMKETVKKMETVDKVRKDEQKYIIFPHSICRGRKIKHIIHNSMRPGVILADSVRNTKINSVKCKKTENKEKEYDIDIQMHVQKEN